MVIMLSIKLFGKCNTNIFVNLDKPAELILCRKLDVLRFLHAYKKSHFQYSFVHTILLQSIELCCLTDVVS